MIRFNVTDHAIQRFQERAAPPMTSYKDAREMLENGLETAIKLKRRANNGEDLWHLAALGCVAICAPDRFGKAERIVRTIITEQMAQIDREGYSDVLEEVIEMEIVDSAEKTVEKLSTAAKHRSPEDHLPAEVRHVAISRKETATNLHRLLMIAQADLAKAKEAGKTRRSSMSDLGNDAKTLLRRVLCAALLDPTSLTSQRVLGAARAEARFEGFLTPVFLRQDPAYAEVLAASTDVPTPPAAPPREPPPPKGVKALRSLTEAVQARVEVLETQAKAYDVVGTSFPPAQLEALCTYRLLLAQLERMEEGEPLQAERLR